MQCRIVITHRQKNWIASATPQFLLQELHEDSGFRTQFVGTMVDCATGAFRIPAHDRDQFIAAIQVVLDAIRCFDGQICTKSGRGLILKRGAQRLPGIPLAVETEGMDLRARHLQNADVVLVTTLQEREVHCRRTRCTVIADVLVQDAFDDGDEPAASRIDWPVSNQLLEYSC